MLFLWKIDLAFKTCFNFWMRPLNFLFTRLQLARYRMSLNILSIGFELFLRIFITLNIGRWLYLTRHLLKGKLFFFVSATFLVNIVRRDIRKVNVLGVWLLLYLFMLMILNNLSFFKCIVIFILLLLILNILYVKDRNLIEELSEIERVN
jgi:hypothetical protein